VLSPTLFWQLSLTGSFILIIYGVLRADIVIIGGQLVTYYIYIRNLALKNAWQPMPRIFRGIAVTLPFLAGGWLLISDNVDLMVILHNKEITTPLILLGGIGQVIFATRFVYQWVYSEKRKESVLPIGFWLISLTGSSIIVVYAVFRHDPVILLGHGFGMIFYTRNLMIWVKSTRYRL